MEPNVTAATAPALPTASPTCWPWSSEDSVPRARDFYNATNTIEKFFIYLCSVVTVIILLDFIYTTVYILRNYVTSSDIKYTSLLILGIYPTVAVSALFALFIPRATLVSELMIAIYFARCMVDFITLMTHYYGGKHKQLERLQDKQINLRGPPMCCLFYCLPKIAVTRKSLRFLKIGVLQGFLLQPFFALIILMLWLDGEYVYGLISLTNAYPYLTALDASSTMLSIYAYIAFYRLCRDHLKNVRIVGKFFALQMVVLTTKVQVQVFAISVFLGFPPSRGILSTQVLNSAYLQIVLILEMFILTLIARRVYRYPHEMVADILAIDDTEAEKGGESVQRNRATYTDLNKKADGRKNGLHKNGSFTSLTTIDV